MFKDNVNDAKYSNRGNQRRKNHRHLNATLHTWLALLDMKSLSVRNA